MLLGLAECKPKIHSGNNNNNLKRVFPRTMSVGSLTMTCQNIKGYLLGKTVTTTKHENDSHLFRFWVLHSFLSYVVKTFHQSDCHDERKQNETKESWNFFSSFPFRSNSKWSDELSSNV